MNVSGGLGVLVELSVRYSSVHGRIVYPVTIVGVLTSVVTIVVLQQKTFRTPTNLILQHVAFFDTMVLVSYNVYAFYFYILHDPEPFVGQSPFWPRFAIFNAHLGLTAHSIALWLTCLLALIRYLLICRSGQQPKSLNVRWLLFFIWCVVLFVCLLMVPTYLVWSVSIHRAHDYHPRRYALNSSEMVYWISSVTGGRLEKISFSLIAISMKILPVFILIVFSLLLIRNIRQSREIRHRLLLLRRRCSSSLNFTRELRTTTMLVLITGCTVVVELPQGLLLIAIGIDQRFFTLYSQLGDFWDLISITSSFITFVMYCSMSQQFRRQIFELLSPTFLFRTRLSPPKDNIQLRTLNKTKFVPLDL